MTGKKQKPTPPAPTSDDSIRKARLAGIRGSVERQSAAPPPSDVMSGVSWNFHAGRAGDLAEFVKEVTEFNDEAGASSWDPTKLVIRASLIRVAYGDDEAKTLRSTSPVGFTMADLLYQIHGYYYRALAEVDHAFFEGLQLEDEGPPPVYNLRLGS